MVCLLGREGRDGRGMFNVGQRFSSHKMKSSRICHSYVNKVNTTEKQDNLKMVKMLNLMGIFISIFLKVTSFILKYAWPFIFAAMVRTLGSKQTEQKL